VKNDVEVKIEENNCRVYINGLIHVSFHIEQFVGIKSYIVKKHFYHIDYIMETIIIETDFKCQKLWEAILKELSKTTIL
jgi:hypothetical protein